ncbi:GlxA family transcriptional regulator [Frankia sp. AgKG'84/4]|uniref:GlxA family transcriptional regulator n=1 Tax=Frankia sp. AgKG'84/4 TaxID=573490 RepID=UPI00200C6FE8|nr:helix-turn-helix domain-containing protein [Frankia sp. AgKG'84/4]MCL9794174.1 helix-turn-helix domain-containing protein [Frankia sp. AgKG'84/4]
MHRIVVLAVDGVIPFELSIPAKLFGAATDVTGRQLYEVLTCSVDGAPVATAADFTLAVVRDATVLATADTVIVPPAVDMPKITSRDLLPPGLVDAFGRIPSDARIVSLCLASYVLAGAGLLDGLAATTHWHHAEAFQRAYPAVQLRPDVLFVDAGRILTSAGAAAAVDLCLHLIRLDHGSGVANRVARAGVVPPWRDGGQAQYVERLVPMPSDTGTAPTREWALERLDQPLRLDDLAAHAGMSRRTFTRRFRAEVGLSPGEWLVRERVDLARHLLEHTDLPVDRIAGRCGFGTAAALRQQMREALAISPSDYRRTFRTRTG